MRWQSLKLWAVLARIPCEGGSGPLRQQIADFKRIFPDRKHQPIVDGASCTARQGIDPALEEFVRSQAAGALMTQVAPVVELQTLELSYGAAVAAERDARCRGLLREDHTGQIWC